MRPEQFRSGNFHPMHFKHLPSFHFNDAGTIPLRKFSSNAFQASSVISLQRCRNNSAPEIFIQCVPNIFRHFTSMRPAQFRSANFCKNHRSAIEGQASMKPEQFSSGNFSGSGTTLVQMPNFNDAGAI
jgi:hypothetical protein